MRNKLLNKLFMVGMIVLLLALPAVAFAQDVDPLNPVDIFLPETMAGFFGSALTLIIAWLAGDGMAWFQSMLNNLRPSMGKKANVAISLGLVILVAGGVLALNVLTTPETFDQYAPAYAMIRTVLLSLIAYAGQQRAYVSKIRPVQAERKTTVAVK